MITLLIIIIIAFTSIKAFNNNEMFIKGSFSPYDIKKFKQHYRFVTHLFLHASWEHLIFNLLTLYFFGIFVEKVFKFLFSEFYVTIYILEFLLVGIGSTIPSYIKNKNNPHYRAIGASGAISGIVFTSILLEPHNKIYFFFIPIGIPAYIFGLFYLILSFYLSKKRASFIAHDVHFYGAIIGFLFPIVLKPNLLNVFINKIIYH